MLRFAALLLAVVAGTLRAQMGFRPVYSETAGDPPLNGITQGASGFVAVGDSGTILYSPDGNTWQPERSGVTDNLAAIAAGPGGYVAVGSGGRILISADGKSWNIVGQNLTASRLNSVASDGRSFIAVGDGGVSLQSMTGTTWTPITTGTTQSLRAIAAGEVGAWVSVGTGGTVLYTIFSGEWFQATTGTTADLSAVTETSYSAPDIISAGVEPSWTFEAAGSDGSIYRIGVRFPESPASIAPISVNGTANLRVIVGGGLWSNGVSPYQAIGGTSIQNAEVLTFDLNGNEYRSLMGTPGWQLISGQNIGPVNGAASDPTNNAIYVVANNGGIYRQANVFRGRLANFSILSEMDSATPETLGLVVAGGAFQGTLIRAVGPSLASFGFSSSLPAPQLGVYGGDGTLLASNAGWSAQLSSAMAGAGAFPLALGSADAAIYASLAPGTSSASITALPNQHGTVLAEIYDTDLSVDGTPVPVNASALLQLGAGGSATVGFTIQGPAQPSFLLRAVGPALRNFGIINPLPDPVLTANSTVYNSLGAVPPGSFGASPFTTAQATAAVGAFLLPTGGQNPVLVARGAGQFTATITSASGVAGAVLIELYIVPLPLSSVSQ